MTHHLTRDTIDLASGEFWARDPQDELRWMRENAPVYWDERSRTWGVARHADIRLVARRPDLFSSAEGIRPDVPAMPMMIDMDDPQHKVRRGLVGSGYTPRRIGVRRQELGRLCDEIIDRVCEKGECDFVRDIAAPLPLAVITDSLGIAAEDRERVLTWSDDMMRALTGGDDPDLLLRAADAFTGFTEYATRVIGRRRACPRDDLISALVHADVDGDRLDDASLVQEALLMLIAGNETTRHVLSGGAWQLFVRPDQRHELARRPETLPTAVEEMLRWVSPVKNMARTVVRDVTLRGQRMRKGDKVLLLYPSANRDATVFENPFQFDVGRTPNDHLAFGNGPHFCLGAGLARLEIGVMFERLLSRLPDMEPATGSEPARTRSNFASGYETLPVRFTPVPRVTA